MRLSLCYPVRPFHINQNWGDNIPCVQNFGAADQTIVDGADNKTCPAGFDKLYSHFGMSGHNGTDLQAGVQPIYAACAGTIVEKQTIASRGLGLGILTDEAFDLDAAGTHFVKIRYWHLQSFNVDVGQHVNAGDLIGYSDNTGYSSGNHLHFEGDPMDKDAVGNLTLVNPPGSITGSIDLAPFFIGQYADVLSIKSQALALGQAVAAIKPTDPNAPQEETIVGKIVALVEQELQDI